MNEYLRIESNWEDESLFEVNVSASNGSFSGVANCYCQRESLSEFTNNLEGFPKSLDHEVFFDSGESDRLSFFTLFFKCRDRSGHIIVKVKVAHILSFTNAPTQKYMSEFDIAVEASAIDIFVSSLRKLVREEAGGVVASLNGLAKDTK